MIWYVVVLIACVFSAEGSSKQGPRKAREEPRFVTARAGESVVLGCDVSWPLSGPQPAYVVEWFRSGVPMPFFISFRFYPPHVDPEYAGRVTLQGKASLRIEQVRSADQGWYECRVLVLEQQTDPFQNGSWVHLTVKAPPTFTGTPPQYVEAREGGSVTLSCAAVGNPKPVVSWQREGKRLGDSDKYQVTDGQLTVVSLLREDGGVYACHAHSPQGEAVHSTHLLIQGSPFIVTPPKNITVNISQNAFFTCQAEAYPANLTYTWYWEEDNVYFKNDLKLRVRILIDGTLIIFRVKPEDTGKYTCSPSNSLGLSPTASAHLIVQYPARVVNMPTVIYVPKRMTGYIRCPTDASPPVTWVKWEKDGFPLRIEKHPGWSLTDDGSIRVTEVTEESVGTYTCMPYNILGTTGRSLPAKLILKDPPYFSVRPGPEYRQDAGKQLLIPCAASGDPEVPAITWRKVGKPSVSKHSVLPNGSLQFHSVSKDDHGEWECVATNVVTSITASTHLLVAGTSPHSPVNLRVSPAMTSANVSWEPGYDGGFEQTFSVWVKKARLGPHDWQSTPAGPHTSLLIQGLEPHMSYQFSVLALNKLGTGPFSEVVTATTLAFPKTTPEPLVLLTPPRCLIANRTQQGILLAWLPPANHTSPIERYIMELRLGDRWEVLDEAIPAGVTELLARDLVQETWYEFRVMAVMEDLISESSNVVGVSSTEIVLPPEVAEEGLARPVVAGVVATLCFLAAAVLFSTLAAFFVNKQRRQKLKRKPDPPLSITHCRKSVETASSSGKASPESPRSVGPPAAKEGPAEREVSKPAAAAKPESALPIELISRGPDGRFVMEPPFQPGRIQGFPFVEESDQYPEFRQSDEENDDPPPMPSAVTMLRLSPVSSSQESYGQPPAYSPHPQSPMTGVSLIESPAQNGGGLHPITLPQGPYRAYTSRPGALELPSSFYMPESSPGSSTMSSPPLLHEARFIQPGLLEERFVGEIQHFGPRSSPLLPFAPLSGPQLFFPPHQHFRLCPELPEPSLPVPHITPPEHLQPSFFQVPSFPGPMLLEAPVGPQVQSPSRALRSIAQEARVPGQLRHTSNGMGVLVLPSPAPQLAVDLPWWSAARPQLSPRAMRRADVTLGQVLLRPSCLSPLTQSPSKSHQAPPESFVRPRPRPALALLPIRPELGTVALPPPTSESPTPPRATPTCQASMVLGTSCPPQSPSLPKDGSETFEQMASQRRTDEEGQSSK
ncbi:protein turtle homolog B isoform X2 [Brienomyrus brachyistius]|uniref:protein turtle homolog B isoform X2 n=1 Tax=Brienomyrus brachyistius TaxID=42636 RepID=UPI0020B1C4A4|nr:protein turtle homolog B isoform X2 [Brienomyrus brachyistius]